MRRGKVTAYILTIFFLTAAVLIGTQDSLPETETKEALAFSVTVSSGGEAEEIGCWHKGGGEYYIFLPGYARLSQVTFCVPRDSEISIGGKLLSDGMSCDGFQLNVPYDLVCMNQGKIAGGRVTMVRSGNVPAMYIDVLSGSMDYIHETKGNEESGKLRLYTADGELNHGGSLDAISGRGNSTWYQDKKPYSLKLSAEADLLGMGKAKKWILLANSSEHSHLKNKLVFDFADAAGLAYSPDAQWVDLYLNGEYAGLYLLCERNDIHPQRVDIPEESGFLVSMELQRRLVEQGYPYVSTETGVSLRIHHTALDTDTLWTVWQSVENAILAEDGIDSVTGRHWTQLIDLDSWARKYLVEELFGNGDAGGLSQYFYSDGARIYAGPVWDYDVSMGMGIWQMAVPNMFYAGRPYLYLGMDQPWYYALYQKAEFRDHLTQLYKAEFRPLMEQLLDGKIQTYAARVTQAAAMNALRWTAKDAAAEAETIQAYLEERLAFLDSVWLENVEYCTVVVDIADGSNAACFALRPGERLPELPEYEESPDILGWYHMDTDAPFDMTEPIYEDAAIYLKRAGG